jgi:hypothetical protein
MEELALSCRMRSGDAACPEHGPFIQQYASRENGTVAEVEVTLNSNEFSKHQFDCLMNDVLSLCDWYRLMKRREAAQMLVTDLYIYSKLIILNRTR